MTFVQISTKGFQGRILKEVVFSPAEKIALVENDKLERRIEKIDSVTGNTLNELTDYDLNLHWFDLSPNKEILIYSKLLDGERLSLFKLSFKNNKTSILVKNLESPASYKISPDSSRVALMSENKIEIVDISTGDVISSVENKITTKIATDGIELPEIFWNKDGTEVLYLMSSLDSDQAEKNTFTFNISTKEIKRAS